MMIAESTAKHSAKKRHTGLPAKQNMVMSVTAVASVKAAARKRR